MDEHIWTQQYNSQNGIFIALCASLNALVDRMNSQYYSDIRSVQNILIGFILGYVVMELLQCILAYWIHKAITTQNDMFLLIPPKDCSIMEKASGYFVSLCKSGHLDELDDEDQCSKKFDDKVIQIDSNRAKELSKRKFIKSICYAFQPIWRISVNIIMTCGFFMALYIASISHCGNLFDIFQEANSTLRMDLVYGISENFHM